MLALQALFHTLVGSVSYFSGKLNAWALAYPQIPARLNKLQIVFCRSNHQPLNPAIIAKIQLLNIEIQGER